MQEGGPSNLITAAQKSVSRRPSQADSTVELRFWSVKRRLQSLSAGGHQPFRMQGIPTDPIYCRDGCPENRRPRRRAGRSMYPSASATAARRIPGFGGGRDVLGPQRQFRAARPWITAEPGPDGGPLLRDLRRRDRSLISEGAAEW